MADRQALIDTALQAWQHGYSVLPPTEDGAKRPCEDWKNYQSARASEERVRAWYENEGRTGFGFVTGKVSGNVEVLDFDTPDAYQRFTELAQASGCGTLLDRIAQGWLDATPSGGRHLYYRCETIGGSQALAKRPAPTPENPRHEDVIIETRGDPAYIICGGTYGSVHQSGKPYVVLSGGPATIATITPDERATLFQLAATLDERPPKVENDFSTRDRKSPPGAVRPGDDFNARASWQEILESADWVLVYSRGNVDYWRRPGKNWGISATTNFEDCGRLIVFTSSTPFEQGRAYSKFRAYTILHHDGDFQAATKELAARGYGTPAATFAKRERSSGDEAGSEETSESIASAVYSAEYGRTYWHKSTRDGKVKTQLANFAARIVEEHILDDGATTNGSLVIEGETNDGHEATRPLGRADVKWRDFHGMKWPMEAWGTQAIVSAGVGAQDRLREAIQVLSPSPVRRRVYKHSGIRVVNGERVYLHAGGAITAAGVLRDVHVELDDKLGLISLPDPPAPSDLPNLFRQTVRLLDLTDERASAALFAAPFRAVLANIMAPDAALHVAGPSGTFKTETTVLVQQFFGAGFDRLNLPAQWISTASFIEKSAFLAADAIFVVDDLAPYGTLIQVQKIWETFNRVIRVAGNGGGRGRMSSDLSSRPTYFARGLVVSSGEDVPRGESIIGRCLIIELEKGAIYREVLTELQAAGRSGVFAALMSAYIQWVLARYDELSIEFPLDVAHYRTELANRKHVHARTPHVIGGLVATTRVIGQFLTETGAASPAEVEALMDRVDAGLIALGNAQGDYLQSEDPVQRFIEQVRSATASGMAHFRDAITGGEPPTSKSVGWRPDEYESQWGSESNNKPGGRAIGWATSSDVYLDIDAAVTVVQEIATKTGASIGLQPRTLAKRINEAGLLASTDPGRSTIKKQLAGVRQRVLHFSRTTLFPTDKSERPSDGDVVMFAQTPKDAA